MRFAVSIAILILAVILAVQNASSITVMLLFWRVDASLAIVIFLCFGLGALAAAMALMPAWYRKHSALKRLQRRISELEADIDPTQTPSVQPGWLAGIRRSFSLRQRS